MTESEKQQIINEVLDSLKVNSLTIEQLVEVASFSSDDCVELTGGRRISLAMLKELFNKELTETVGKKLAISDLASGRGESTTTAMTQAAVTQELVAQEEKLTELSSGLGKVGVISNIYNKGIFAYKGYIDNTGNIVENDGYRYTDYIQVDGDVSIDYKLFGSSVVRVLEASDESGSVLNHVNGRNPLSDGVSGVLSSTTNRIKKVRFCCSILYLDNATIKIDSDTTLVNKSELNKTNIRTPIMSVDGDVYKRAAITINTGVINYSVDKAYKLIKFHTEDNDYYIYTPGSANQETLWEYTDDSYSTPKRRIIGNISTKEGLFTNIKLEEGYYAFSWNGDDNSGFITNNKSFIYKLYNILSFRGIICNGIITPCAITAENGKIRTDVVELYKAVKFFIKKGLYYISTPGSSTQESLWKYTDETYATPEKRIIGKLSRRSDDSNYEYKLFLEEGYYAFSWNDGSTGIQQNAAYIYPIEHLNENGISSFSDFSIKNQSFEISEDRRTAKSLKTGYENRIQYNTPTYEDKFILSACLEAIEADSSGYFEMCIGKWYWLSGTIFCLGKDSEGGYLGVYRIDDSETPSLTNKYRISEFSVETNTEYNIVIEKTTESQSSFSITITNNKGITYSKVISGKANPEEGEDTGNEGNGSDAGYAWGNVCLYSVSGSFEVSDIYFNYPVNRTNLKLIVSGHSFIEGNSIWQNKDKRFAALLCKDLGLDETIILGQGGATTTSILKHIEKQLSWLNTARYILFCIGTNDADSEENANKLGQIDAIAQKYGLKTIWLTITPRYDLGDNHPIMNAYIKEHFNYIDINDIFYEDDGITIRRDMLFPADNVHPTIPAHELIYKVIKAKCSYLYSLK